MSVGTLNNRYALDNRSFTIESIVTRPKSAIVSLKYVCGNEKSVIAALCLINFDHTKNTTIVIDRDGNIPKLSCVNANISVKCNA